MRYETTEELRERGIGSNGRVVTPGSRAVAEVIQARMAALGVRPVDVAARLGCTETNVTGVLRGRANFPSRQALAWADALELVGAERECFLDAAAVSVLSPRGHAVVERIRVAAVGPGDRRGDALLNTSNASLPPASIDEGKP